MSKENYLDSRTSEERAKDNRIKAKTTSSMVKHKDKKIKEKIVLFSLGGLPIRVAE